MGSPGEPFLLRAPRRAFEVAAARCGRSRVLSCAASSRRTGSTPTADRATRRRRCARRAAARCPPRDARAALRRRGGRASAASASSTPAPFTRADLDLLLRAVELSAGSDGLTQPHPKSGACSPPPTARWSRSVPDGAGGRARSARRARRRGRGARRGAYLNLEPVHGRWPAARRRAGASTPACALSRSASRTRGGPARARRRRAARRGRRGARPRRRHQRECCGRERKRSRASRRRDGGEFGFALAARGGGEPPREPRAAVPVRHGLALLRAEVRHDSGRQDRDDEGAQRVGHRPGGARGGVARARAVGRGDRRRANGAPRQPQLDDAAGRRTPAVARGAFALDGSARRGGPQLRARHGGRGGRGGRRGRKGKRRGAKDQLVGHARGADHRDDRRRHASGVSGGAPRRGRGGDRVR